MMGPTRPRYNQIVREGLGRGAIAMLLAFLCYLAFAAPASADEQFDVGSSPVLNVRLNRGQLNIQTWDRQQVQISSDRPLFVQHLSPSQVDPREPKQFQIASQQIQTEHGPVTLPAESFVIPDIPGNQHDAIVARGGGNVTITIPRNTGMVIAHVRAGRLSLNDYHGIFVAHSGMAEIALNNVGGTGFVESLRGKVTATNSSFDRLRVRTATGDMLFRGCTSHQIQATSTFGSIVYDNGHFQAGLARFESEHGNVALGVQGGAQIGAHSGAGHVVSSFHSEAHVQGNPATKQATVRGGGPVVTATSRNGSVYLYSGSINEHPRVRQELNGSARLPTRPPGAPPSNFGAMPAPAARAEPPAPRMQSFPRSAVPRAEMPRAERRRGRPPFP
jgi:Putative adhesin